MVGEPHGGGPSHDITHQNMLAEPPKVISMACRVHSFRDYHFQNGIKGSVSPPSWAVVKGLRWSGRMEHLLHDRLIKI
jgi:hypothetical protein